VSLPHFQPLPLTSARAPFSHADWLFEVKWDGFRALLYSDKESVRLVSRNGNVYKSFPGLCEGLARDLSGRRCVLDGEIVCLDLQGKPQFTEVVPERGERLLYCDHIDGDGEGLFRLACQHDLEGIVAKRKADPYLPEHAGWLKIRNHDYSRWANRQELFERERETEPDFELWNRCAAACSETDRTLVDAH
jgi:bifunctional non-homologous end joining protein LigD